MLTDAQQIDARDHEERPRLVDERPRGQMDVGFLWIHHLTASVNKRTMVSSKTPDPGTFLPTTKYSW